jgi:hypothetical protein
MFLPGDYLNCTSGAMKRALTSPCETSACETFFALDECLDIMLGALACPLLVASMMRLCRTTRRAVWRVLADPGCCSAEWITDFTKRLWTLVTVPDLRRWLISPHERSGGASWPFFLGACKHTAPDRFYVGRFNQLLQLEDASGADWDGDDTSDEDAEPYWCGETMAHLTSYSDSHQDHFVQWQPVCCGRIFRFAWHYVARALADNVDMRVVLYNRDRVQRSYENGYLFIQ